MSQKVIILDTTLRDGEQSLQASLTVKEKLQIAVSLERLGVDIIEAGFPISSPGDFKSVQMISERIKNSKICSLARCIKKDIEAAGISMRNAKSARIHLFLGTSDLHIKSKLKKNFFEIIEMAIHSIKIALKYTDDVQFSCEDAGRTSIDNLCRIVESVIKAGATTINIPDTVGYTIPSQFKTIIKNLFNRVPNIDNAIISAHCHDDLGLAAGNAIASIEAGVRQIEGTISGIGERAGNTALEEVILTIKLKEKLLNVFTNIKHNELYRTSQLISQLCNTPIPANKSIIGSNAFAHSSGIHQDGILKNRANYEIIDPKTIGVKAVQLNLTSRSGRAAVKHHMREMGYQDDDYDLNQLYLNFLKLADKKGQVFDYDLEALAFISNQEDKNQEHFQLKYFSIHSDSTGVSTASVKLLCGDKILNEIITTRNGPVNSIYQALNNIAGLPIVLEKFHLVGKGEGRDALGQVDIVVKYNNRKFHGIGLATDIIESSIKAMLNVLNNIWLSNKIKSKIKNIKNKK
ncbi:2-isopropylmalate synthase (plasmid) [Buchnera aphidicola (Thelaxes suberi)]|uniref:2-isopropylmalate synthase n=1 Tax=Buchnera aphidicola TaxID=9 RepID=UPI003463AADD